MTIMDSPKPTPVSTSKTACNIRGPCRFKRLKLFARTITKNRKAARNATPTTPAEDARRTLEMIKETLEFIENPHIKLPLVEEGPNNFATIRKLGLQTSAHSSMHSMLLTPSQTVTESNSQPPVEVHATGSIQQLPTVHMTETLNMIESAKLGLKSSVQEGRRPGHLSVESASSLLPLSNAFRETTYPIAISAWALPRSTPSSANSSISVPLSPSFLNPRQAPTPPGEAGEPDVSLGSSVNIVKMGVEAYSCNATLAGSDSFQSTKYNTPTMDRFQAEDHSASLISGFTTTLASNGSGLERIGAALLRYNLASDESRLLGASCSTLDDQDRSLGSLLDTMERHGGFVRELPLSSNSATTFTLPSINSVPSNLIDSSSSLNDLLRKNSQSSTKATPRVKSVLHASFAEKLSHVEQILQEQGVIAPSSQSLTELWNALSMGTTRESSAASRARDILQSIAECEIQDQEDSTGPSDPLDFLGEAVSERVKNVLKSATPGENINEDSLAPRKQDRVILEEELNAYIGIAI